MKARLDTLGRIRETRRRLRDMAAGTTAAADAEHERAAAAHDDAAEEHAAILGSAPARLGAAGGVSDLLLLETERLAADALMRERALEAAAAKATSDEQRAALRLRARDLRVSEKVVSRVRARLTTEERKREQRDSDDLSATRSTRNP